MKPVVIIPARYESTRLPGKPMALIKGKPMIQRVWEQACKIPDTEIVIVATDDRRIFEYMQHAGARVMMTSKDHVSGSDRVAEVAQCYEDYRIILNVQGDLPYVSPLVCDNLVTHLNNFGRADIATPVIGHRKMDDFNNPSVVKAIFDLNFKAMYFSRQGLPYMKEEERTIGPLWYRHIGLYAYRNRALQELSRSACTELEKQETLEQLRALEYGYHIRVVPVLDDCGPDINLPEDLEKVNG